MFTGIVTDVGKVRSIRETNRDRRFEIETAFDLSTVDLGASISHAGCCLTVVEKGQGWFAVEVSGETLSKTTLDAWAVPQLQKPQKSGPISILQTANSFWITSDAPALARVLLIALGKAWTKPNWTIARWPAS